MNPTTPTQLIYKYALPETGSVTLNLTHGTSVLSVQLQDGQPTMWAAIDPHGLSNPVVVHAVLTGQAVPENSLYIGTLQLGWFVVHYYIV